MKILIGLLLLLMIMNVPAHQLHSGSSSSSSSSGQTSAIGNGAAYSYGSVQVTNGQVVGGSHGTAVFGSGTATAITSPATPFVAPQITNQWGFPVQ